jgi:molybdate transport system substrate-binding protein
MAKTLQLLSSMAPREILFAAIELYNKTASTRIEAHAAGGVEAAKRVASGEAIDIVVLARDAIDALIGGGWLSVNGQVDLIRSGIGVAVREGAMRPSIFDAAGVRHALKKARTIGWSTGPSGKYLEALVGRWQLLEDLRSRIVVPPPGIAVARWVAAGKIELGFQQLSELLNEPGIEIVGLLPDSIQHLTTFKAAVSCSCRDPSAAQEFLSFLSSPLTREIVHRYGMTPIH